MHALVTGGAGFIGSHLAAALLAAGHRVRVLDNLRSGNPTNLAGLDVEFQRGSILDAGDLSAAMRGIDVVFHLAAMVSVPESMEKPRETEEINTLGTLAVLAAAKAAGARKLVLASSSAVYGFAERPIHRESDLPEPASPYAISKLAGEHYCRLYASAFGLETAALRFFNVYGPRQDPRSAYAAAVAIFTARSRAGEPITIYGDGQQTRDFIFVGDVASALVLAAERGTGTYNVSRGERLSIEDLAHAIMEATGHRVPIHHAPPRAGDVKHSRGDATRLRELGWEPKVSLAEGLRRTVG